MSGILPVCLERIAALGLPVFQNGDYDLNLFGIRTKDQALTFNDMIGCAYKVGSAWRVHYWPATTDPSWFYLKNASERFGGEGTAILVADRQYRGAYKLGPHGSTKYEALVQIGAGVDIHRDADKDRHLDTVPDNIVEDTYAGINIHASSSDPYNTDVDRADDDIGPWSAGCQVHATNKGFRSMIALCHKQIEYHPSWTSFSYTLLNQWW